MHSVADAIVKNVASLEGCTLYTTIFPCHKCTQLIIQSRIKNVEYLVEVDPKHRDDPDADKYPANCWMMTSAGVKFRSVPTYCITTELFTLVLLVSLKLRMIRK